MSIQWQDIVDRDPFLAGSIVARNLEWWQDETPFAEADSVGLVGEKRDKFLEGWSYGRTEQEKEWKEQQKQELTVYLDEIDRKVATKGDPVNW